MGVEAAFTEGRSPEEWRQWLYDVSRQQAAREGVELPDWATFRRNGWIRVTDPEEPVVMLADFRADPDVHRLATPSGKIEITSGTIASFGYDDCPGHPVWLEPLEWLGNADSEQLHMLSNQPRSKLHSQLDHGSVSRADRLNGFEPVTMHPDDAKARGLTGGDTVRIFNDRGACHAALKVSDEIRPGVIQIATGAWFAPDGDTCQRGNPNTLTPDKGTSKLAQGPIAHSCLVRVEAAPEAVAPDYLPPLIERCATA